MSVTYTRLLGSALALPGGYTVLANVPADALWVVRCVTFFRPVVTPFDYIGDVQLVDENAIPICGVGWCDTVPGRYVVFEDLRQVVQPSGLIAAICASANWSVRVSGFVFTAP